MLLSGMTYRVSLDLLEAAGWDDVLMGIPPGARRDASLVALTRMRDAGLVEA